MRIFAVCTPGVEDLRDQVFLPSIRLTEPEAEVYVENLLIEGNGDFWGAGFQQATTRRLELIVEWIGQNAGEMILVSDLDTRYLRPFLQPMVEALGEADIAFQRETAVSGANIGQMVIRCSDRTASFFLEVLAEVRRTGDLDQIVVNKRLNRIPHGFLPPTFANTKTGFREGMCSFHAICTRPRDGLSSTQLKFLLLQKLSEYLKSSDQPMSTSTGDFEAPYTVALVAMGPSHAEYVSNCLSGSSRFAVADETWAINAMGNVIEHDRLVCMDALPYFAKAARELNPSLAGYKDWLHLHPGPIYTQKKYEGFPGSVEYPLKEVLGACGYAYFNNTVAYAVGLAILMKVKHLKLFGCDFTAGQHADGQTGRACVEYWLANCIHRGMKVTIASTSTLCDQKTGRQLYGYSSPPDLTTP